ncbi:MAG: NAD-dependent epimerase/dehydratase family protein, partial [Actinobacteria bacterium]|nr:NAD-dependent epimerase/dehydratase family protein [Actinomycetota bacterium]
MRLLVTGGTGFTGSRLVEFLLEKGYEVTCLDNQKGLFFDYLAKKGAKIILGSVTDREAVRKSLEGVEGVFHLAAAFRVINVPKKVYWDTNVEGTRLLCEEILKRKI